MQRVCGKGFAETHSHQGKGATIKDISTRARHTIEEFLGIPVYLDLHVMVRRDRCKKDEYLREIGLLKR